MTLVHTFAAKESFVSAATDFLATHLLTIPNQDAQASLFLSGGATPGPVYEQLSDYDLPWQHIKIGLVDERWVDESDSGSNAALIRTTLLQNRAHATKFYTMTSSHETATQGQSTIESRYNSLLNTKSVAVLGMGPDGHTASWFPGAAGLSQSLDIQNSNAVQAIYANPSKVTGPYLGRMTLTLHALAQCSALLLLTKGQEKRAVLEQALKGPNENLPVSILIDTLGERLTILHLEA